MLSVKENLNRITGLIEDTCKACSRPVDSVHLIAVSKRKDVETVRQGIEAGAAHLGENYIQEAVAKIETLGKKSACWHFIGHLQSNKARFAVPCFEFIHTVDTFKLAKEINKQAAKINKVQNILIQVNISGETTKSGTTENDAVDLAREISSLDHVALKGLMCMPPFFADPEEARPYFRQLAGLKDKINALCMDGIALEHLSMGMSNDFRVAIEEGATMVRVGTSIFGERD